MEREGNVLAESAGREGSVKTHITIQEAENGYVIRVNGNGRKTLIASDIEGMVESIREVLTRE